MFRKLTLALVGVIALGAASAVGQMVTRGMTSASFPLTGSETGAFDTNLSGGRTPQTESISVNQLAGFFRAGSALTSAASLAIDASLSNLFTYTIGSSSQTLATPTNLSEGQRFQIVVRQNSTGGFQLTAPAATLWKWRGINGQILVTAANAVNKIDCTYDGTSLLCDTSRTVPTATTGYNTNGT